MNDYENSFIDWVLSKFFSFSFLAISGVGTLYGTAYFAAPFFVQKPQEKVDKKKEPNEEIDFKGLPTEDPLMKEAANTTKVMASREKDLLGKVSDIKKTLRGVSELANGTDKRKEFYAVIKEVRDSVKLARRAIDDLGAYLDFLLREIRHAPQAYSSAAVSLRNRANDYTELSLRNRLTGFAMEFEQIARKMPEREAQLSQFQNQIPKFRVKVKEAETFLDDTFLFLESHPGGGISDPREKYSTELKYFIQGFSELLRMLESFKETIQGSAISVEVRKDYEAELKERLASANRFLQNHHDTIEKGVDWLESQFAPPKAAVVENKVKTKPEESPSAPHTESQPATRQTSWRPTTTFPVNHPPTSRVVYTFREPERTRHCCFRVLRLFFCRRHR